MMEMGFIISIATVALVGVWKFWQCSHNQDCATEQTNSEFEETQKVTILPKQVNTVEETKVPNIKAQMTAILHRLGFQVQETEDDIRFTYEGINMAVIITADEHYLSVIVPGIIEVTANNELETLRVAEQINNQLKYVKAYFAGGTSLWLSYERQLHRDEIIEDALVEAMIANLSQAHSAIGYFISKVRKDGKD